jgi:hypothetical protein
MTNPAHSRSLAAVFEDPAAKRRDHDACSCPRFCVMMDTGFGKSPNRLIFSRSGGGAVPGPSSGEQSWRSFCRTGAAARRDRRFKPPASCAPPHAKAANPRLAPVGVTCRHHHLLALCAFRNDRPPHRSSLAEDGTKRERPILPPACPFSDGVGRFRMDRARPRMRHAVRRRFLCCRARFVATGEDFWRL